MTVLLLSPCKLLTNKTPPCYIKYLLAQKVMTNYSIICLECLKEWILKFLELEKT